MRDSLQSTCLVLHHPAMVIETRRVSEPVQAQKSLNRHDDHMSCGALDGILEQKKVEGRELE